MDMPTVVLVCTECRHPADEHTDLAGCRHPVPVVHADDVTCVCDGLVLS